MRTSIALLIGAGALVLSGPAMAFDWNGFYAGVNVGYTTGESDSAYSDPDLSSFGLDSEPAGWSVGVGAGANFSVGNGLVLGIEGDVSASDVTDTIDDELGNYAHPITGPHYITSSTSSSGTLRGRIGFDGGDFLPFLTAGLAVANVDVSATDGPLEESATLAGWAAGGGVEFAATDTISVKLEYLYSDLGDHTWFEGEAYESQSSSTSHTIRAGLNFQFD